MSLIHGWLLDSWMARSPFCHPRMHYDILCFFSFSYYVYTCIYIPSYFLFMNKFYCSQEVVFAQMDEGEASGF